MICFRRAGIQCSRVHDWFISKSIPVIRLTTYVNVPTPYSSFTNQPSVNPANLSNDGKLV